MGQFEKKLCEIGHIFGVHIGQIGHNGHTTFFDFALLKSVSYMKNTH